MKNVILFIGPGRVGLNKIYNSISEMDNSDVNISINAFDLQHKWNNISDNILKKMDDYFESLDESIVGDIATYHLPLIERYLNHTRHNVKVVYIYRKFDDFKNSFKDFIGNQNFWFKGKKYDDSSFYDLYPNYDKARNIDDALKFYWNEYYDISSRLKSKFKDNVIEFKYDLLKSDISHLGKIINLDLCEPKYKLKNYVELNHEDIDGEFKPIFICKKRNTKPSFGLINSARFVSDYLEGRGINSIVTQVLTIPELYKLIDTENPSHVIIEAIWINPENMKKLTEKYKKIKFIVRIHSDIGFLAVDSNAIKWTHDYQSLSTYGKNLWVAVNVDRLEHDFKSIFKKEILCLPTLYYNEFNSSIKYPEYNYIDIASFGALRQLKNQLFQCLSAIKYANLHNKKLRFHVNFAPSRDSASIEKNMSSLFRSNNHELVKHEWMDHSTFLNVISTMDLGMQISFTETFNIVTADFISRGVPILVSDSIEWAPDEFKTSTTDTDLVVSKLGELYKNRNSIIKQQESYNYIQDYNIKNIKQWDKLFYLNNNRG